ncbi:DUF3791 domain-containing protein [Bacteroides sp. UBA939]|uniref:DUF3791 domain-containing protein n=1 Tax=Bacteroides sp. UBA939 TaxID=1946092 RepID=UPI0025BA3E7E|nr:DUF3791 domain-containing protein [Bacteroides sp. UBA939]
MWNKIGRIVTLAAKQLNIEPERAFDVFYESKICERLHDSKDYLYMMGDHYIVDELVLDLQSPLRAIPITPPSSLERLGYHSNMEKKNDTV